MSNFVNLMDIIYPVGSIYQSMNATSTASSIGGTWTRLNTFLYGSTTAKNTGGEATHTLSIKEMPAHSHSGSTGEAGGHGPTIDGRIIAWYGQGGGNVLQGTGDYFGAVGIFGGKYTSDVGDHTHTIASDGGGKHTTTCHLTQLALFGIAQRSKQSKSKRGCVCLITLTSWILSTLLVLYIFLFIALHRHPVLAVLGHK